jgi:hypothetical protein
LNEGQQVGGFPLDPAKPLKRPQPDLAQAAQVFYFSDINPVLIGNTGSGSRI